MKILVTGGAGYVGGFTTRHLMAQGHDVVVIDDLRHGHLGALPREILTIGDIADTQLLGTLMAEHRVDAVMHFAASIAVGESVENPGLHYRNNTVNTLGLLEAMVEHGVGRIVFSSTAAVYGDTDVMPIVEDAPKNPSSPYGTSKLTNERMIQDFARAHGISYGLLRYFNAAGAAEDGSHGEAHGTETHLIPLVIQTLLGQRDSVSVFGDDWDTSDGTCLRDYIHVDDLALAHQLLVEALPERAPNQEPRGRIYNVGTGQGATVMEVIQAVEKAAGEKVPFQIAPRRAGDPARLVASSDRLREELGWRPRFDSIDAIVETAWRWHRSHPQGYASA